MDNEQRLLELVKKIPDKVCGVYYFLNSKHEVIYIGKSIDIKKRALQHFRSKENKEIKLQFHTHNIHFENLGSELIALLRESELIKNHLPVFNRAQRKTFFFYGLYTEKTTDGYEALSIQKINPLKDELLTFTTLKEAKDYLFEITEKFNLCQKINGLYSGKSPCFQYQIKVCQGACVQKEAPDTYNKRVKDFIKSISLPKRDFLIQTIGRNPEEKGIVFIENGCYKGFGYCTSDIHDENELRKLIQPKQDNRDVRRILFRHIRNNMK